ncbi:MAG: hemolysin activation protein [Muribaculum sp.]|nr:hemolysin activation protein [Muribaculum sp.]
MKYPSKIDVPVLITFFVRPETLEKVFASVKEARPSTLLLWQDGPRKNRPDDIVNVEKCRKIVENIDWECTVYRNYHTENMGCDPSTFLAQKWAFSLVDKCIILEDDRVPVQSFYPYCKELLDKYEFDNRINHICGTNLLEDNTACEADYFFAQAGSTTWATWKRVAQGWDEEYSYLDDEYAMKCLENSVQPSLYKVILNHAKIHRKEGKQYWETILGMDCLLNNRLAIIPKKNMVVDLGLTENSTHAVSNPNLLPKFTQRMFFMKAHEVCFPLKHPKYVIRDNVYYNQILSNSGIGKPFKSAVQKFDYIFRCIRYGEFKRLFKSLKRRFV